MSRINSLIKNECANYFPSLNSIRHYCCLIDKPCIFFNDKDARCNYFEMGVLPLKPNLEIKYREEKSLSTINIQATCKRCLASFVRKVRHQKYCDECSEIRKKEQAKLRKRKSRMSKSTTSSFSQN